MPGKDQYPGVEKMGLLGPKIKDSLKVLHAQEFAKSMMTGGVGGFEEGGTVPKTGIYKLHEGEHVIPASNTPEINQLPPTENTRTRIAIPRQTVWGDRR